MLALSLSVAPTLFTEELEVTTLEETVESLNVISLSPLLNGPGSQEGSIFTDTKLSSGGQHTCAILDDGTVSCWGANTYGQLGDGIENTRRNKPETRLVPTLTTSLGTGRTAVAISSGEYHTCAILDDGSVSCWGENTDGQLGDGTTTQRNTPTQISSLGTGKTAVAISSGVYHTCAILDDGTVSCWGNNGDGQLGDGTTTQRGTPTQTSSLGTNRSAVALSSGGGHNCALLDNGTVSCWGRNLSGELGDGTQINRNTPTPTSSLGITPKSNYIEVMLLGGAIGVLLIVLGIIFVLKRKGAPPETEPTLTRLSPYE